MIEFGGGAENFRRFSYERGAECQFGIFMLVMFFFWILASITGRVVKRAVSASKLNVSHLLQEMLISIASRVDMTFSISYGDDVPHAERILSAILDEHEKVLSEPKPKVKLQKLGESSVDFIVRPWVRTEDYWDVYWDITREVKMRFERESILIPFPKREVYLIPQGEDD